ncbi:MAG: hypothetical protein IPH04_21690 [Saprospirales bacterium]|nr:hypothetical protein [Saprospirales bacterium]
MIAEEVALAYLVLDLVPEIFEVIPDAVVEVFEVFHPFLEVFEFGVVGFFQLGGKDDKVPFCLGALDDISSFDLYICGEQAFRHGQFLFPVSKAFGERDLFGFPPFVK